MIAQVASLQHATQRCKSLEAWVDPTCPATYTFHSKQLLSMPLAPSLHIHVPLCACSWAQLEVRHATRLEWYVIWLFVAEVSDTVTAGVVTQGRRILVDWLQSTSSKESVTVSTCTDSMSLHMIAVITCLSLRTHVPVLTSIGDSERSTRALKWLWYYWFGCFWGRKGCLVTQW